MIWFFIGHIFSILLSLIRISRLSENDKDLEIIILRHQLDVMVRKQKKPIRPNRADKATLALLTAQLKKNTQQTVRQLGDVIRIVRPETVTRRHRELVRCKWSQPPQNQVGRPRFEEIETRFRCLIRDNDKKYTAAFDTVFQSQQTCIVPTPLQAPNANAYSERWVRTAREEILDHILIIGEAHLRRVLIEFINYYNNRRPHQSLDQQSPMPRPEPATTGKVERRQILGGIISDYHRITDTTAVCLA